MDEEKVLNKTQLGGKKIWTMFYRSGNNPRLQKNFLLPADQDISRAAKRARQHCEVMGYIYIYVRPFLSDLDEQEKLRAENHFPEEDHQFMVR